VRAEISPGKWRVLEKRSAIVEEMVYFLEGIHCISKEEM
jgi:hypothetical protein